MSHMHTYTEQQGSNGLAKAWGGGGSLRRREPTTITCSVVMVVTLAYLSIIS